MNEEKNWARDPQTGGYRKTDGNWVLRVYSPVSFGEGFQSSASWSWDVILSGVLIADGGHGTIEAAKSTAEREVERRRTSDRRNTMNDETELDTLRREKLITLMEDISEDHYAAAWLIGLEDDLWRMVEGGSRVYGMADVPVETVEELRHLANAVGHWFDGEDWIPLDRWRAGFAEREAKLAAGKAAEQAFIASARWEVAGVGGFFGPRIQTCGHEGRPVYVTWPRPFEERRNAVELQREVDLHNATLKANQ